MITLFEGYGSGRNKETYSVGDYLLIDLDGDKVKVISKSFATTYDRDIYVELSNGENKHIDIRRNIYRRLFPSEIEKFKIEQETKKYNI